MKVEKIEEAVRNKHENSSTGESTPKSVGGHNVPNWMIALKDNLHRDLDWNENDEERSSHLGSEIDFSNLSQDIDSKGGKEKDWDTVPSHGDSSLKEDFEESVPIEAPRNSARTEVKRDSKNLKSAMKPFKPADVTDFIANDKAQSPNKITEKKSTKNISPSKLNINIYQRLHGKKSSSSKKDKNRSTEVLFADTDQWRHAPEDDSDPSKSLSLFSSLKDRMFSFLSGENEQERKARLRLSQYCKILEEESRLMEQVAVYQASHGRSLLMEFDSLESQLILWAQWKLLILFRNQAWARVARASLLHEMSVYAHRLLDRRCSRAQRLMNQWLEDRKLQKSSNKLKESSREFDLRPIAVYCSHSPELIVNKDQYLMAMAIKLVKLDKLCLIALSNFRTVLPSADVLSTSIRKKELYGIVKQYAALILVSDPTLLDDRMPWIDICNWYCYRQEQMLTIEESFSSFIEDEREREGRLFHKWCSLILSEQNCCDSSVPSNGEEPSEIIQEETWTAKSSPTSSTSSWQGKGLISTNKREEAPSCSSSKKSNSSSDLPGITRSESFTLIQRVNGSTSSANLAGSISSSSTSGRHPTGSHAFSDNNSSRPLVMKSIFQESCKGPTPVSCSPRSIVAFIRYFTLNVLAVRYQIPSNFHDALIALTEAIVYRRINHRVFRYNTDSLILRDIKWRNQCRLARSLEPCHYGVPTEYYVSKNDRLSASNGRNDRNDSSSIASSEKNSKALPPSSSTCNNENHSLGGGISLRSRFADLSFSSVFPYGSCYAKASRIFSMMSTALTPKSVIFHILFAIKILLRSAVDVSGKNEILGADLMFPILVQALLHSSLPNLHLILQFLYEYGLLDCQGEASYYFTCLEAAVAYIMDLDVSSHEFAKDYREQALPVIDISLSYHSSSKETTDFDRDRSVKDNDNNDGNDRDYVDENVVDYEDSCINNQKRDDTCTISHIDCNDAFTEGSKETSKELSREEKMILSNRMLETETLWMDQYDNQSSYSYRSDTFKGTEGCLSDGNLPETSIDSMKSPSLGNKHHNNNSHKSSKNKRHNHCDSDQPTKLEKDRNKKLNGNFTNKNKNKNKMMGKIENDDEDYGNYVNSEMYDEEDDDMYNPVEIEGNDESERYDLEESENEDDNTNENENGVENEEVESEEVDIEVEMEEVEEDNINSNNDDDNGGEDDDDDNNEEVKRTMNSSRTLKRVTRLTESTSKARNRTTTSTSSSVCTSTSIIGNSSGSTTVSPIRASLSSTALNGEDGVAMNHHYHSSNSSGNSSSNNNTNNTTTSASNTPFVLAVPRNLAREEESMAKLGEWIRDQNTMEDTISILQQEGWMV